MLVLFGAMFIVPQLMQYIPNFDPLMAIVGLFAILALAQHLTGPAEPGPNDEAPRADGAPRRSSGFGGQGRTTGGREQGERDHRAVPTVKELVADAERCLEQNSWTKAETLMCKATDQDPECAKAWELLATAQKWQGKRKEALETVRKARDIYEVKSKALQALARELDGQSTSASSSAMAAESAKKAEDFVAKRMYDLGLECCGKSLDSLDAAEGEGADADKALRLRVVRCRAECSQQLQDWSVCRADATVLLEEDPADPQALLQRAAANEALEKFKAALEDARKLLAADPRNVAANRIVHNCSQALRDGG